MSSNNLATRILVALIGGILVGTLIQHLASPDGVFQTWLVSGLFHVGGDVFASMIKLMVMPLVFISIVNAVCSLDDINQFGRLGAKTLGLYLLNTVIAIGAAISIALILKPGQGADFVTLTNVSPDLSHTEVPSLMNMVIGIVPTNPVRAFAEGNILQILFMAIITGIAIKKLEDQETHSASKAFSLANNVMMELIGMVMALAPYGVFFLTARLAATLDSHSIISVMTYVMTASLAMLIWLFGFYPLVTGMIIGISPVSFIRKIREQMMFALSTASSNATIPVTFRTLTDKLGVSKKVTGFSVPLGATMNMSGAAIYMTVATMFVACAYNIDLNGSELVTLGVTTFLLAVATGGIPGGAVVTTGVLLHQLGLPVEALGVIIATDRILDALSTVTNVVGDTVVSTIVAKTEGEIDEEVLYKNESGAALNKQVGYS